MLGVFTFFNTSVIPHHLSGPQGYYMTIDWYWDNTIHDTKIPVIAASLLMESPWGSRIPLLLQVWWEYRDERARGQTEIVRGNSSLPKCTLFNGGECGDYEKQRTTPQSFQYVSGRLTYVPHIEIPIAYFVLLCEEPPAWGLFNLSLLSMTSSWWFKSQLLDQKIMRVCVMRILKANTFLELVLLQGTGMWQL